MFTKPKFHQIATIVVALTMLFSMIQPAAVSAQNGDDVERQVNVQNGGDGVKRQVNAQTGRVSFIGPESGRVLSASEALGTFARPENPAFALASRYAPEFGLMNPARDLIEMKSVRSEDGRLTVRYQQMYQGIPVMSGELIVNTNDNGDLYSMNGEVSPDISLPTQSTIDPVQAAETAMSAMAKWYQKETVHFLVSEPELWINDEGLLRRSTRPVELVWRMEVTTKDNSMSVRELVLVDAQTGNISLHFNQIDTAWHSSLSTDRIDIYNHLSSKTMVLSSPLISTYTANHVYLDRGISSGSFLCNQTQLDCTQGDNVDADAAHKHALGTYDFYATIHQRDSINNAGMNIISTVDYGSNYANAFWNGAQMAYGDAYGFALADDVVAHELTHGVTQYESDLFYYYQSGAINESFSDLWGEYYDQTNGQGNDDPSVKWLIGEDVSGLGAIRSMSNPPGYEDPDKMSSLYYYEGTGDNGGVHYNSGVNNKAVYLMVDDNSIVDAESNPLGGINVGDGSFNSGETYTISKFANVDVTIGGDPMGSYTIPPTTSSIMNYPNMMNGLVKVVSTSGENIFASQRSIAPGGLSEEMGHPASKLAKEYWFTWYNRKSANVATWILVGNPSDTDAVDVEIYIAGQLKNSETIPAKQSIAPTFNVSNRPLDVRCTNCTGGKKIFTSERIIYGAGTPDSFNETFGVPDNRLSNQYYFTWYDNRGMQSYILIGKP